MLNRSIIDTEDREKIHIGSYFIMLGTVLLFLGSGSALGIADNYFFFMAAIVCNFIDFILHIRNYTKLKIDYFFPFFALVIVFTILYLILGSYDRGTAFSMLMYAVLIISISICEYSKSDAKNIINGVVISSVIFSVLVVFFGKEYMYSGTNKYTFTQTFGSKITFEPNYLGSLLTLGFCLAVYMAIDELTDKKKKAVYISSAIIVLVGLFLTGSRSALVSIFLFAAIVVIFMKPGKTKKAIIIFGIAIVILVVILILTDVIPQSVYIRMLKTSYNDRSNSKRVENWICGLKAMFDSPLIGNGPYLTIDILRNKYGFVGDAHNTFITIGVMYGVPVLLLFIYAIIKLCYELWRYCDRVLMATFIAMIFEWNIIAAHFCIPTWLTIIILLVLAQNKKGQYDALMLEDTQYVKM